MNQKNTLLTGAFLAFFLSTFAQAQTAMGDQFQVNTYTTGPQYFLDAAALPTGGFVVTWQSYGSAGDDDSDRSIQARVVGSDGNFLSPEFQVNSYTSFAQFEPRVSAAADGSFVVAWTSEDELTPLPVPATVQARRFASDGSPLGEQFEVGQLENQARDDIDVAVAENGDFVVVWNDQDIANTGPYGYTYYYTSILARRFASDGTTQGQEFRVNDDTLSSPELPSIGIAANGDFIITWQNPGLQGQRYASDGSPLGTNFQVNEFGSISTSAITVGPEADFIVTWAGNLSNGDDDSSRSVQARRFSSDGLALGLQFQVNSTTLGYQGVPTVGIAEDGRFLVFYASSPPSDPNDPNFIPAATLFGQLFSSDGGFLGGEFQVNQEEFDNGLFGSAVAMSPDGQSFLLAWGDSGSFPQQDFSIQARFYGPTPTPVPPTATATPSPTPTIVPPAPVPVQMSWLWWGLSFFLVLLVWSGLGRFRIGPSGFMSN